SQLGTFRLREKYAGGVPTPAATSLSYMWPKKVPQGLVIRKAKSSAGPTMFTLALEDPAGGQFYATVTGGPDSTATNPPARGTAIVVRGQPGTLFTTGAGYSVFWREAGQPYAVVGGLPREDALALAESLEPLDLATWSARLQALP
ncbi:MAG TPA: DUF4367 domain-containing protein, partial [Chloroflexia bacterium]|nr:DUF4367 domain-containing protein [Chloroflexia bacterium]